MTNRIDDLQLDNYIKTMATQLDEMLSSFDFLVYKYCHENEKTRAPAGVDFAIILARR